MSLTSSQRCVDLQLMKRALDLLAIWPLLPTFRSVAELQHLSNAAAELDITPAAVSRTLSKLEQTLGIALFERVPRGMLLTDAGVALLERVRENMRSLDDAIANLELPARTRPRVRLGFSSHALGWVINSTLPRVEHDPRWPENLDLEFSVLEARQISRMLLSGDVDVCLTHQAGDTPGLVYKSLGALECGYLKAQHMGRARVTIPPAVTPLPQQLGRFLGPVPIHLLSKRHKVHRVEQLEVWRITRSRPQRLVLDISRALVAL